MGNCFLIGSEKNKNKEHGLKVLHYIEYLTFNLEQKIITVYADFFIKNISARPACLRGLHRGNIDFRSKTRDWFVDKIWTPVFLKVATEEIGLMRKNNDQLLLRELGGRVEQIDMLDGDLKTWGPRRSGSGEYVCFSGWESPGIEAGRCVLLRIRGSIEGATYERLMPAAPCEGEPIKIVGGEPLQEEIKGDLIAPYDWHYKTFEEKWLQAPAFYHVLFERGGGRGLKTTMVSSDMTRVWINEPVEGGRHINWYWSDTDFNVYAQANGPVLEMVTERKGMESI